MIKTILVLLLLAPVSAQAEPEKCQVQEGAQILQTALETVDYQRRASRAVIELLERENTRLRAELVAVQAEIMDLQPKPALR